MKRGVNLSWAERPEGGFAKLATAELAAIAWLFLREGSLKNLDARLWAAGREIHEQRSAHRRDVTSRGVGLDAGYEEKFSREEFQELIGTKLPKSGFRGLREAGILLASEKSIRFGGRGEVKAADPAGLARFTRTLERLGPDGLYIPVPRRMLRYLAKHGTRGRFAAVFAVLISSMRYRDNRCSLEGEGTLHRLATLFGVSERGLRNSVRELEALGWVATSRVEEGLRFSVNAQWCAPKEEVADLDELDHDDDVVVGELDRGPVLRLIPAEASGGHFAGSVCQTDAPETKLREHIAGSACQTEGHFAGCTTLRENSPSENTRELRPEAREPGSAGQSGFQELSSVGEGTRPRLLLLPGGRNGEATKPLSQVSGVSESLDEPRSGPSLPRPAKGRGVQVDITRTSSVAQLPEPSLRNLRAEDLEVLRAPRRDVLFKEGVALGWWPESEHARRELECAAVHAARLGEDPVRHFAWLLRGGAAGRSQARSLGLLEGTEEFREVVEREVLLRRRNVTDLDDDQAQENLASYAKWLARTRGESAPWWLGHLVSEARVEEPLSEDAKRVGAILRRGKAYRDSDLQRALAKTDASWTRERWNDAKQELEEKNWGRAKRQRRPREKVREFVLDCKQAFAAVFGDAVERKESAVASKASSSETPREALRA